MKTKKQYRKALAEGIRICQELREHAAINGYYTDLIEVAHQVTQRARYQTILHKIHLAE